jgi:hypothetical protein
MPRRRVLMVGENPGDPRDLLVPMARIFYVPPDPQSALKSAVEDLPYALGGRAVKPTAPLMMQHTDGSTTILPGFGVTEAAELQELAYRQLERKQQDWRERWGFPDRQSFDARLREHMDWRAKHPGEHQRPMSNQEREARRRSIPHAR